MVGTMRQSFGIDIVGQGNTDARHENPEKMCTVGIDVDLEPGNQS